MDELDLSAQLDYIINNPIRNKYTDYPHIHTTLNYAIRLDSPQQLPT